MFIVPGLMCFLCVVAALCVKFGSCYGRAARPTLGRCCRGDPERSSGVRQEHGNCGQRPPPHCAVHSPCAIHSSDQLLSMEHPVNVIGKMGGRSMFLGTPPDLASYLLKLDPFWNITRDTGDKPLGLTCMVFSAEV